MIQFTKYSKSYQRENSYVTLDTWKIRRVATKDGEWKIPSRMFGHYTLIYLAHGSLLFNLNGKQGVLSESSVLCAMPSMQIDACPLNSQPCHLYIVEFDCNDFVFFELKDGYSLSKIPASISESFYKLNESAKMSKPNNYVSDATLLIILQEIGRNIANQPGKQSIYDEIKRYIVANIYEPLTVEKVSLAFNYNKDYLGRVIRNCGNTTLKKMIVDEKINAAKTLLVSTNYTISKISSLLRFKDANDFFKFFKYHTNTTPAVYRATSMS